MNTHTPELRLPRPHADLNVGSPAGAAVLYRRIHAAAEQVCAISESHELSRAARSKTCVTKATAEAVAAVNAPALTGYSAAKVGNNTRLASLR